MNNKMKNVIVANDHGAVELAQTLVAFLENSGYHVDWLGTKTQESVDYPEIAEKACKKFLEGSYEFGVLCCGTGIGISICANKINGIRCALPQNCYAAEKTREHNHANFIAFGGRIDYPQSPEQMLKAFIEAVPSQDSRHLRRIAMIEDLEKIK